MESKHQDSTLYQKSLATMYRYLAHPVGLLESEWQDIVPHLTLKCVDAKYNLQAAGQPITKFYFIVEGLTRLFYITLEGKDMNKGFYNENHIVGSLSAVILNEPCRYSIQTLEPSVLLEIDLGAVTPLLNTNHAFERLFNYGCRMMLIRNERREAELLTMTAKQRFLQFVRNYPDYLERIPQYHIASYLGITPVALSKYKRQWLADR